ncbi:2-oxoacid:acceptor oxidoreductase subunit alpha [Archaeoglobales archaeon]|nr:MAG: 2-oxoacid:acceptor oxidoreductase subunit alpha [Archaeoglobales archaeon]
MKLIQGNEAVVKAAIKAGCRFYAGYPITPSSEVMHLMAKEIPKVGGVFVQMEDEIASIAAAIGASMAGKISMTATSGPGFSLMQENIGYAAMAEIPVVIVNVMRAGPSTGIPTAPSQGDVMQAIYGSHGDYPIIVLCPSDVIDSYLLTAKAFYLAEKYRSPVVVLSDEIVGHMREGIDLPEVEEVKKNMPVVGKGKKIHYTGLANEDGFAIYEPEKYEKLIKKLYNKIEDAKDVISYKLENPDAKTIIFAYGSPYRTAKAVLRLAKNVGIFKAETLFPFPEKALKKVAKNAERIIVPEMNVGKIVKEVERVVGNSCEVISVTKLAQSIDPYTILRVIENE